MSDCFRCGTTSKTADAQGSSLGELGNVLDQVQKLGGFDVHRVITLDQDRPRQLRRIGSDL